MVEPAQSPDDPQEGLSRLQEELTAKAPVPWVTFGIIGLNVAAYLAMLLAGVHFMEPKASELLAWGANQGSATTAGQWWRLLTCTFLHIGLIHLLFNMAVLQDIGRFMERLTGPAGFAVVYLLSGVAGSVASMWWNPHIVSAGASGAIFGLYGGLLGYLLAGSRDIPVEEARKLRNNALVFLGYNLIWGLTQRQVDMAGHLGGLLGGLACGFAMARRLRAEGPAARPRLNLQILAAGAALLAVAAFSRPRTVDFQREWERFSAMETRVQAQYHQALQKAKSGALADQDFALLMQTEVIDPWRTARLRLEGIEGLPPDQARLLAQVDRYAQLRERAWETFAEALRQQDPKGVQQASALHAEAEKQLEALGR